VSGPSPPIRPGTSSGIFALTSTDWLTSRLDPVAHYLNVARVAAATTAPDPEVFDPVDPEPTTGSECRSLPWVEAISKRPAKKRSLTSDQWDSLAAEVPKLADRFDRAASTGPR